MLCISMAEREIHFRSIWTRSCALMSGPSRHMRRKRKQISLIVLLLPLLSASWKAPGILFNRICLLIQWDDSFSGRIKRNFLEVFGSSRCPCGRDCRGSARRTNRGLLLSLEVIKREDFIGIAGVVIVFELLMRSSWFVSCLLPFVC